MSIGIGFPPWLHVTCVTVSVLHFASMLSTCLQIAQNPAPITAQRKAAWIDLVTSSNQKVPPTDLYSRVGVDRGTEVGTVFCTGEFLPPNSHHWPHLSCFPLALGPELFQVGAGVIQVNTDLALEWLPCHQSTLKKKETLLSKQEYPHQAGLQPNGGWFSSSLAAKFL